ncbi:hypothetical protein L218DRAFT_988508 [Marasmius fiardii PR-910]|nr:hypothetical protein L218DRAFT_988508 [Marasmius fiardii PR-910]
MRSSLDLVPPDVLQHIAFLLESHEILSSHHDLLSLLLTCSAMYNALSPVAAPHLYARIFRTKFDTKALHRRLPLHTGALTDSLLTHELMLRCRLLARVRSLYTQSSLLEEHLLDSEDLRTALRMTLESEGLNEVHLASVGLVAYMTEYLKRLLPTKEGYPSRHVQDEDVSLALWLLVLNWSQADACNLSEKLRRDLIVLLRPFVHPLVDDIEEHGVNFFSTSGAKKHFQSDPHMDHRNNLSTHRRADLADLYSCPSAASAAILLTCALKEVDKLQAPPHLPVTRAAALSSGLSGPTMEDYRAISSYSTSLFGDDRPFWKSDLPSDLNQTRSLRHDPSFFHQKLESNLDCVVVPALRQLPLVWDKPSDMYGYISKFLEGVWAGYYMVSSLNNDVSNNGLKPSNDCMIPDFICRTPMQASFSLYFCFHDCGDLSLYDIATRLSDFPSNTSGDDQVSLNSDLSLEVSGRRVTYRKLSKGSKGGCQLNQPSIALATDCVMVGQTLPDHEQAWRAYRFVGRVRKEDGLITFRRVSKHSSDIQEGLGAWTFKGHLRYGTALVGTWNSSPSGTGGIGGVFGMGKQPPSSSIVDQDRDSPR